MAESVTYADLRFVKAPLKKRLSSQLGQDPEADDDGELTYENVQVPPISGGASNLASSGLGDRAGVPPERPKASWSSVTSPAARRLLGCPSAHSKYLLLGLLLTCLLLGMAAISLGVRYLQVSQQLQRTNSVLEATNSSLRQQLHLRTTQLGQKEQDLQGSRRELAQSQEALQMEQRGCQAVKEQLQSCLNSWESTKETLRSEEEQRKTSEDQRRTLEERLNRMQDTLKPFFTCHSPDTCCPVGWILKERNCFHISLTKRSWQDSLSYCNTLSSSLATTNNRYYILSGQHSGLLNRLTVVTPQAERPDLNHDDILHKVLEQVDPSGPYWVEWKMRNPQGTGGGRGSGYSLQKQKCASLQGSWIYSTECTTPSPCICEIAAFRSSCQQEPVPLIPNPQPQFL